VTGVNAVGLGILVHLNDIENKNVEMEKFRKKLSKSNGLLVGVK
jgi:hypothetical protein